MARLSRFPKKLNRTDNLVAVRYVIRFKKRNEEDTYVAIVLSAKKVLMGIEQNPVLRVADLGLLVPVFGFQPGDSGRITLAAP
jgi:hypothetical protein